MSLTLDDLKMAARVIGSEDMESAPEFDKFCALLSGMEGREMTWGELSACIAAAECAGEKAPR